MLKVIDFNHREEWDSIVDSFNDADIYYLSSYLDAFKIHGDGEPLLFYFRSEKNKGIYVAFKRDVKSDIHFKNVISPNTFFDLISPYGYGGWIFDNNNDLDECFTDFKKWCVENSIICDFVRFHPVLDNYHFSEKFYHIDLRGHTITMDLDSTELIWQNLDSKNRNMIRKAEKNDITIHYELNQKILKIFKEIYDQTMKFDDANEYYFFEDNFYLSILNELKNYSKVFYAMNKEGKVIAASIMIFYKNRLNYHLSGSLREFRNLAPSNLLLCKAAEWGSMNNFKTFHLGGGLGSAEDNLYKFKKSFNKNSTTQFATGYCIFDEKKYAYLCSLRKNKEEINSDFFPYYRG